MATIFISYRRAESAAIAGRLYDRLCARYGKDAAFMDVDSIPAGVDFRGAIRRVMRDSIVQLVVIGPQWTLLRNEQGTPRILAPDDTVRYEIETALERGLPIIPLLAEGAAVPAAAQLPESIRPLSARNALPLRSGLDFETDIQRIIQAIDQWLPNPLARAFAPATSLPPTGTPPAVHTPPIGGSTPPAHPPLRRGAGRIAGAIILLVVTSIALVLRAHGIFAPTSAGSSTPTPTQTTTSRGATALPVVAGPEGTHFQQAHTSTTADGMQPATTFSVGSAVYVVGTVPPISDGRAHTVSVHWYLNGTDLALHGPTTQVQIPPNNDNKRVDFSLTYPQPGTGAAKVYWDGEDAVNVAYTLTFTIQ